MFYFFYQSEIKKNLDPLIGWTKIVSRRAVTRVAFE